MYVPPFIIFITINIRMSKPAPTSDDLTAAHYYAMSKLCGEIPEKFGRAGRTEWDDRENVCRITEQGCNASVTNPISQPMFTSSGDYRSLTKNHVTYGKFWEKNPPGFYVWKTTKKSPNKKVCARANFLLWQWCMMPRTRADKEVPGVTNTPRFEYNIRNGKEECYIPKQYCDSKGVSYNANERDCYVSDSQKILEFFTGSVLIRKQRASDKRLKDNIMLLKEDFPVKGTNVYTWKWNDIASMLYGLSGHDIGFIADELDPRYVTSDEHGFKHIKTEMKDEYMLQLAKFLHIKEQLKNLLV